MQKAAATIVLIFFNFYPVHSQVGPVIQFEKNVHDFGIVKEEANNVITDFKFKNVGDQPLIISDVQAACGCTTPGWTDIPVLPGKSGYVRAAFNPRNRPGSFNKSLNVTSNSAQTPVVTLFIKGNVEPQVKTIEETYPNQLGNIRTKSVFVNYGTVYSNKTDSHTVIVYNSGAVPVKFLESTSNPGYVKVTVNPNPVPVNAEAEIVFEYDLQKKNDFGYVRDKVLLYTNEPSNAKKEFWLSADVKEYFPAMSDAELAQAPKISVDKAAHDFGKIRQGESVTHDFELANKGKKDLIIRKLKPNCGCLIANSEKTTIKPGETVRLSLTFNTAGRIGGQSNHLIIYANDPRNPEMKVFVTSQVE